MLRFGRAGASEWDGTAAGIRGSAVGSMLSTLSTSKYSQRLVVKRDTMRYDLMLLDIEARLRVKYRLLLVVCPA